MRACFKMKGKILYKKSGRALEITGPRFPKMSLTSELKKDILEMFRNKLENVMKSRFSVGTGDLENKNNMGSI